MKELDNNKILDALRSVADPATGQDMISSGRITEFQVRGLSVSFSLSVQGLDADTRQQVHFACQEAIMAAENKADVNIHMFTQKGAGAEVEGLPQVHNIIAVASGKGGVGKSTVSVNLAMGLKAKGARVGIIDADLYGPSIPIMLGLEGQRPKIQTVYGKPKIIPLEKDGIFVMSIGFVVDPEQAVVMRGPRLGGIIKQFIHECVWPELDYLVIDLPPGTGDIQLTLVQTLPVTGCIIVTTPQKVSVADALKAMNMFRMDNINVPIIGVIENMSWFTPEELPDNKYFLFGSGGGQELADTAQSILLGQVPLVQSVRESGDNGTPVMADMQHPLFDTFMSIAEKTIQQLDIRNENQQPSQIVRVQD